MNEEFEIREFKTDDQEAIIDLLRLNTPAFFAAEEESDLVEYLSHHLELYFVVILRGQIIGCGGINFTDAYTTGRISWDIVHPDYHGKGIGRKLLEHRIAILKANPKVSTISVRTSQLAYKFYEKSGFELKEIATDYWAKGFDLYRMEYLSYHN